MFFDSKSHLLPGTEPFCQCAQDEDMALCMAYDAYKQGCRFLMATPPDYAFVNALQDADAEGIPAGIMKKYQSLRGKIGRYLPDMELGLGCEIRCSRGNLDDVIHHLNKGHLPTMNGSACILVSFADQVSREELWFCLDRLDRAGYRPILSHAQSLQALKYDIHEIRCLKGEEERGHNYHFRALIQVDMLSLRSAEMDPWSEEMLRSGVVDMLATDAKNTFSHPPHIRDEVANISKICSSDYLQHICWNHAAGLLHP